MKNEILKEIENVLRELPLRIAILTGSLVVSSQSSVGTR